MSLRTDLIELAAAYADVPADQVVALHADTDRVVIEWAEFPPRGEGGGLRHHTVRLPLDASPRGGELSPTPLFWDTVNEQGLQPAGPVLGPRYPKGTPEYERYAADLRAELALYAARQPPYNDAPPTTTEDTPLKDC